MVEAVNLTAPMIVWVLACIGAVSLSFMLGFLLFVIRATGRLTKLDVLGVAICLMTSVFMSVAAKTEVRNPRPERPDPKILREADEIIRKARKQ